MSLDEMKKCIKHLQLSSFIIGLWKWNKSRSLNRAYTTCTMSLLTFLHVCSRSQLCFNCICRSFIVSFREYRPKENVTQNDNFTITFLNHKSYVFDLELSVGPDTEKFASLNLPVFVSSKSNTISHLYRY